MYNILESTDKVGIEFSNNQVNIYFPLGYDLPKKDDPNKEIKEKEAIIDLINTISICKNDETVEEYNYAGGEDYKIPVNSYLWIINDYLKNGLYNVKEKKYISNPNGKINWKKTFKTKPIFTKNNVYYLNPIVEVKTNTDDIITEIQCFCINTSIDRIGFLFGNITKIETYVRTYSNEIYINLLNKELSNSFDDRKKIMINHMLQIIKEKSLNDKLDIVNDMLVKNYNYAWEKMIDYTFGNVINKREYFPEIIWDLHSGNNPLPTMRPDTIIHKQNKIYILDAKYYSYGVKENGTLPGAESVDKQITYGEYNSKKYKNDMIYNAFVLPFNMHDKIFESNKPIITIGTVKSAGRSSNNLPIVVILFDTKYLIDLYFKREKKEYSLLLDCIINELKSKQ